MSTYNKFLVLFDDGEHWVDLPYASLRQAQAELEEWGAVIELTGSSACPTRTIMPAAILDWKASAKGWGPPCDSPFMFDD